MPNPFDSTNQTHVAVRPINKGMFQNLPSNGLPDGGFWRVQNFRVETGGLTKRGGLINFNQNTGVDGNSVEEKMLDIIYFYQRSGGAEQLLLTDKHLYLMQPSGINQRLNYTSLTGTVISNTASSNGQFTITTLMTADEVARVRPGDLVTLNGIEYEAYGATGGDPNGAITLNGDGVTVDEFVGVTATMVESFFSEVGIGTSYAVLPTVGNNTEDKVIIADQGGRGLYEYTTGVLKPYVIDSTDGIDPTEYVIGGKMVTYFDDRLWICNTEEIDGEFRQRIRWTNAVDFDRISPGNYTDLPYTEGQILRLVPLGALLVAYYADAVYLGRRTNIAGQPYYFERMEAGNVGLVNSRAVVRHIDTHYFVGEDNIYMLSGSAGFQPMPIGDAILDEAFYFTKDLELLKQIQVEHDIVTKSIVFMFPDKKESSFDNIPSVTTRLWRFYYKTQAWAYDEVPFETAAKLDPSYLFSALLPSNTYVFGRSWDDWYNLTGSDDVPYNASWDGSADPDAPLYPALPDESFADFETWTALADDNRLGTTLKIGVLSAPLSKQLIVEEQDKAEEDEIGALTYPVWVLIETGDFDVGMPDFTKTVTRLSLKSAHIYSERESPLVEVGGVFTLNISDAMGYHWKRPMTLRFKSNYNEGYANFRSTGSTFRFKLVSSQVIAPYRLSEYIMRMVGRGLQVEN